MKKYPVILLVIAAVLISSIGFSSEANAARVYVSPPEIAIDISPDLVVIPGTYVYRIPDIEADILFYQGFWYRPFEGRWYRSRHHNGPWGHISRGRVPGSLLRLPGDYYRSMRFEPHHRIHYGDLHKNWRGWERQRHWDRDDRWREGRDHGRRDHRDRGHDRDHRDRGRDRGDRGHDRVHRDRGGHGPGDRR